MIGRCHRDGEPLVGHEGETEDVQADHAEQCRADEPGQEATATNFWRVCGDHGGASIISRKVRVI